MVPAVASSTGHVLLAVVGASGGLGTSVLAGAVALRARRAGVAAVLVDGCPHHGGLDITMGVEHEEGVRWGDLIRLTGVADGAALAARLPGRADVPVLSFGPEAGVPPPEVVRAVVAGLVEVAPLVVVDTPPDGEVTSAVAAAGARAVVVSGTSVRQLAALAVVTAGLRVATGSEPLVCLRVGSGAAAGASARSAGRLVRAELGLDVLTTLGDDRSVVADLVHGAPPGTRGRGELVRAADVVLGWAVLGAQEPA